MLPTSPAAANGRRWLRDRLRSRLFYTGERERVMVHSHLPIKAPAMLTISPLTRAEYRGFDDGFFGNARQISSATHAESDAYARGHTEGVARRSSMRKHSLPA